MALAAWEDCASSIYALRTRVAVLAADGTTPAGATNMYVSDALVRVDHDWEFETPADITKPKGDGSLCINIKGKRVYKSLTIGAFEICTEDPVLNAMISGGAVLSDGGDVVGYGYPQLGVDPVPNGISLEFWSRAVVGDELAGTGPYIWWAVPRAYLYHAAASVGNSAKDNVFTGYGTENSLWGNGPNNDWSVASDRALQAVRTTTLPEADCAAIPTPAQPS